METECRQKACGMASFHMPLKFFIRLVLILHVLIEEFTFYVAFSPTPVCEINGLVVLMDQSFAFLSNHVHIFYIYCKSPNATKVFSASINPHAAHCTLKLGPL